MSASSLITSFSTSSSSSVGIPSKDDMDFSSIGIYGRDREREQLHACLGKVLESGESRVAWIEGEAGAGKSTLAQELLLARGHDDPSVPIFGGLGKFEESTEEPSQAILRCFDSLIEGLLSEEGEGENATQPSNTTNRQRQSSWADRISETLCRYEIREIARHSEALQKLMYSKRSSAEQNHEDAASVSSHNGRSLSTLSSNGRGGFPIKRGYDFLWLAFRSLCQCLGRYGVVVLILEDWHWADPSCYHILQTIIDLRTGKDTLHNLLLVCTSRQFDAENGSKQSQTFRWWKGRVVIEVGPLKVEDINDILVRATRREVCLDLASLVLKRTGGYPLFVIQYLQAVARMDLFSYSECMSSWEYDARKIDRDTRSTELVDILAIKVRALPRDAQEVLLVAACLEQATFDIQILRHMVGLSEDALEEAPLIPDPDGLKRDLQLAVETCLIECCTEDGRYRFFHDWIWESIRDNLLPTDSARQQLHKRIGLALLRLARGEQDVDQSSFRSCRLFLLAVQQLNLGNGTDDVSRKDADNLANLNIEAAESAFGHALFQASSQFCEAGLALFPRETRWNECYDLTMKLSKIQCGVLYLQGKLAECESAARSMIENADCLLHQTDAYYTLVQCLLQQEKCQAALTLLCEIHAKLGVKVPSRSVLKATNAFRQVGALFKLRALGGAENLPLLPKVHDPCIDAAFEFLHLLQETAHLVGDTVIRRFGVSKIVSMVLEYGKSKSWEKDVMVVAVVATVLGKFDLAKEIRNLSFSSLDELTPVAVEAGARMLAYAVVDHWNRPITVCLEDALTAKNLVMEAGLVDDVFKSSRVYASFYFECGLNLKPLEVDLKKTCEMLTDFGSHTWLILCQPFLQFVHNLMGLSPDPLVLTGDAMNQDEFLQQATRSENARCRHTLHQYRMIVCYIFNDYDAALSSCKELIYAEWAMFFFCTRLAFEALTHFAVAARQSTRRRPVRQARSVLRRLKTNMSKGCPNLYHLVALLTAEDLALSKKGSTDFPRVREAYDHAISTAGRLGILHIQAIANERAGLYCLCRGETDWASTYLTRARCLYEDWGASAKSKQLQSTHGRLLQVDESIGNRNSENSMFVRTRQRLEFSDLVYRTKSSSFEFDDLE